MGLAGLMSKSIQDQRVKEMKSANEYRWLVLLTNMTGKAPASIISFLRSRSYLSTGYTPSIFAPVITFVVFEIKARVQGHNSLSLNQAITSLATITLLMTPASTFLTAIPQTSAAIGCFERIQKYLIAPSWEDTRARTAQQQPISDNSSPSRTDSNIELQQLRADMQDPNPRLVFSNKSESPAIVITGMTAGPSPTSEPAIFDIDLQLKTSTITIFTGPVGSGKSTLMKAILGELALDRGDISVSSTNMAYCSQTHGFLTPPFNETFAA